MNANVRYDDVYVVDDFDEAEQFRYEHNDEPVEVGTAVGFDEEKRCMHTGSIIAYDLHCFPGIYFVGDNDE